MENTTITVLSQAKQATDDLFKDIADQAKVYATHVFVNPSEAEIAVIEGAMLQAALLTLANVRDEVKARQAMEANKNSLTN